MKNRLGRAGVAVCLGLAVTGPLAASTQLEIPPRRQWDNRNGYCGEMSVQQIALYYGTYVSQYRAREIIDPTQTQDLWIPDNSAPVFEVLRLTTTVWNSAQAQPQYQAYLVWTKAHLQQGHPVVIDAYVQGESDPAYDHIMVATGFTSSDTGAYHATDTLVFNDHYETTPHTRTFGSLFDTRAMSANGAAYEYCIPRDVDYGCAVTGIRDDTGQARPVSLSLDRWDEPNVSQGAAPVLMTATIQIRSLVAGRRYALLRYNDYHAVPVRDYLVSAFSTSTVFTATNGTQRLTDRFMSDAIVIYRCVEAGEARPAFDTIVATPVGIRLSAPTLAGRRYGVDWRAMTVGGAWSNLTNQVLGDGGLLTITDPAGLGPPGRFYRLFEASGP